MSDTDLLEGSDGAAGGDAEPEDVVSWRGGEGVSVPGILHHQHSALRGQQDQHPRTHVALGSNTVYIYDTLPPRIVFPLNN